MATRNTIEEIFSLGCHVSGGVVSKVLFLPWSAESEVTKNR